ncbi:MAG: dTDP-4-dehydrorhamnose reductase [Fusobacteriaceae bacterium]|nr:dTDP-4-dehydrorhamnose reductase [Fusobacteriaceae bacterium]
MILLTGANGQLGTDFKKLLDMKNISYIATDFINLDITNMDAVRNFVKDREVSHIINCAAYNNVDKAEEEKEKELCYKLNTEAQKNLAIAAKEIGAIFVTYSTDFVFGGEKHTPYTEEDKVNPLCIYAESKAKGETEVLGTYDKVFVIRTSWVFGMGNNNFNKQVINWAKTKNELNIVDDQVSSPTYSWDLAEYSWDLINSNQFGLYQLSNDGECSKYEQAKYVLEAIGWQGKLGTAKTVDFNLPAKRAAYSKISSEKAEKIIGRKMPSWQSGIDRFLKEYLI